MGAVPPPVGWLATSLAARRPSRPRAAVWAQPPAAASVALTFGGVVAAAGRCLMRSAHGLVGRQRRRQTHQRHHLRRHVRDLSSGDPRSGAVVLAIVSIICCACCMAAWAWPVAGGGRGGGSSFYGSGSFQVSACRYQADRGDADCSSRHRRRRHTDGGMRRTQRRKRRKRARWRRRLGGGAWRPSARTKAWWRGMASLGRRIPPRPIRARHRRAAVRQREWLRSRQWYRYVDAGVPLPHSPTDQKLGGDEQYEGSSGPCYIGAAPRGGDVGQISRGRRCCINRPAHASGESACGTSPLTGLLRLGRRARAAILVAVLLALRIGEAANPGPWPGDAISLEAGGWKAVGDGRGLSEAPRSGRYGSTTSPFDDPELQETDDDDYAHLLEADGPLGDWSTAPPIRRGPACLL